MHNLEHFLKHVEDNIATDDDSVASLPVPTSSAAAKGKKNKTKAVVEVEAEPVVEAKSSKKEGTLNGGVNFVLNDIDNAHSLVRTLFLCPHFLSTKHNPYVVAIYFDFYRILSRTSTCSIWVSLLLCRRASPKSSTTGINIV